jgi:hypothetical protein
METVSSLSAHTVNFVLVEDTRSYWERNAYAQMSAREEALCIYSDFHKEVHGCRPYVNEEATAGQIYRQIKSLSRFAEWERQAKKEARTERKLRERQEQAATERATKKATTRQEWTLGDFWNLATA